MAVAFSQIPCPTSGKLQTYNTQSPQHTPLATWPTGNNTHMYTQTHPLAHEGAHGAESVSCIVCVCVHHMQCTNMENISGHARTRRRNDRWPYRCLDRHREIAIHKPRGECVHVHMVLLIKLSLSIYIYMPKHKRV